MWLTQKCLNLLRLKQICTPKLTFGIPLDKQLRDVYPEQNVINYLKSWNKDLKQDEYGNLYIINPWTPLLSAHMDTVQWTEDAENMPHIHINKKKWTISYDKSIIWWDDKCGIALAMELYEKYWNKVSLIFSRQEETWHNWATEFCRHHLDLLKQCKYCLVMDRKNAWDIISSENGYCSKEFEDEIYRCTKDFWYKPIHGSISDADAYSNYINCVNLSVWYYNAHTKSEFIVIEELKNAFNAVCNIIENFQWEYDIYHEPEKKYTSSYYGWWLYSSYYWGRWDSEYDWSRSNSRSTWQQKWKVADKKEEDTSSKEAEYTRQFFKIRKNGKLEIKEDIILVNPNDIDDCYAIPQWVYEVMDRADYTAYEDAYYYNSSFNCEAIQDGVNPWD